MNVTLDVATRRWIRRAPTGALILFAQKGTARRAAAKLTNGIFHDAFLAKVEAELKRRRSGS